MSNPNVRTDSKAIAHLNLKRHSGVECESRQVPGSCLVRVEVDNEDTVRYGDTSQATRACEYATLWRACVECGLLHHAHRQRAT